MELNYYVLGKKDNKILQYYLDKYYILLLSYLNEISLNGILTEKIGKLLIIENKDFVINPDQSSLINFLYKELILKIPQNLGDVNVYMDRFEKELDFFIAGNYSYLIMNKGTSIYGTNIKLTIKDNNPYNINDIHPDHIKDGVILGYGEKTEKDWLEIYEKTFNLLKNIDEGFYSELNQIIKKIVPLGTAKSMHNSASYKECVGHLYMGYTIDSSLPEVNNLEAIIHESSHNKLNLIMQFDQIVLNDRTEKYYSAIRPDARHIHGVFLGYHAFAPTMYIVMKAYINGYLGNDENWLEKIILYYIKTKFLQKIVKKYALLTDLGKKIREEIDYVINEMDILFKEINPPHELIIRSKEKQMKHFKDVNLNYPNLEY